MRASVSTTLFRPAPAPLEPMRSIALAWSAPRVRVMGQPPESETRPLTEQERRDRLVYWVQRRMKQVAIASFRDLAKQMGVPNSNVSRWLGKKSTGGVPLIYLPELCLALRVDPAWFTMLPAIPEDPLAPYTLPEKDPFLVALAATRLARRDQPGEAVEDPPVGPARPSRPRRPAAPRRRGCPR